MTLEDYLSQNDISLAEFGKLVGERPQNVHRWAKKLRIPRPAKMQAIAAATGGLVLPADFYAPMPIHSPAGLCPSVSPGLYAGGGS